MFHHIYTILWGENELSSETKVTQKKSISTKDFRGQKSNTISQQLKKRELIINKFIKPLNGHNAEMS